jgi:hypothetical protein
MYINIRRSNPDKRSTGNRLQELTKAETDKGRENDKVDGLVAISWVKAGEIQNPLCNWCKSDTP